MYNAFISYSHAADGKMAPALQHAIKRFSLPWYKPSSLSVFRDESNLSVSPHLWDNIQQALDNSEYLIYMASPLSANSKWVQKEVEYWVNNKSLDKIILVVTDGEIDWDEQAKSFNRSKSNCVPKVLQDSFTQEPFYIDLRKLKTEDDLSLENSIFNKEVLKISAELYGKTPIELAGEEVKAQNRTKRITTTVITVLAAALITTFYFFNQSRTNQKKAEFNEAVADSAKVNVGELLQIALQGRGDQYSKKPLDSIIYTLEEERTESLEKLISPRATRSRVGNTVNYDYLIWIDLPLFRADSIVDVAYEWPSGGYKYVRDNFISSEASTGFAFGYRGTSSIKRYISISIKLKGNKTIYKNFNIKRFLEKKYNIVIKEK